jgi:hypothetical protein
MGKPSALFRAISCESDLTEIVIGRRFCGPPNSGNGGYVCGVLAKNIAGPATSLLRAPVPLDGPLQLKREGNATVMTGAEGQLIGRGEPAPGVQLPKPPPAPSLAEARAARARHVGLTTSFHPICFTCGTERAEGDGLRVFAGQLDGAETGVVACAWTPDVAFAEADGLTATEVVWAALDCPGYFAWVEREGRHGALLGTMTGEVLRRPMAGEECIIVAWPLSREGRKETAGVVLYSATGELMARAHQVWIVMGPRPSQPAAA